jgi:hypothetical protein
MQLTILGKNSNYTSWLFRTKWKLKMINPYPANEENMVSSY